MDKEELRQKAKDLRLAMGESEAAKKSEAITTKLVKAMDWSAISSLHCYIPLGRLNEVNTWPLLKYVWQEHPRIITAVSSARKRGKYEAIRVSGVTRWRGLVPASRIAMPKDFKYDLIIVPTLAFDRRGYRLGWGGGFYDRFLAGQPMAQKIGLCFENGRLNKIPNEQHDIALDEIVTEL